MKRPLPRWIVLLAVALAGASALLLVVYRFRGPLSELYFTGKLWPRRTVQDVLDRYGAASEARFRPLCEAAGVRWPPARLKLLAFKAERQLEVWASSPEGPSVRLATYPVLAASGGLGPKLRQGDRQVPEGFYRLSELNPNSQFHLSIR